jgi:hypothetical protein
MNFMPLFMLAIATRNKRKRLADKLLPALIPLVGPQRLALAVVTAEDDIRSEDRRETALVNETVTAVQALAVPAQSAASTNGHTSGLPPAIGPTLRAAIGRNPALAESISATAAQIVLRTEETIGAAIETLVSSNVIPATFDGSALPTESPARPILLLSTTLRERLLPKVVDGVPRPVPNDGPPFVEPNVRGRK